MGNIRNNGNLWKLRNLRSGPKGGGRGGEGRKGEGVGGLRDEEEKKEWAIMSDVK